MTMKINLKFWRACESLRVTLIFLSLYCAAQFFAGYLVVSIINFFKNHTLLNFKQRSEIAVIDHPGKMKRFKLNYILSHYLYNVKVILSTEVTEADMPLSLVELYKSAEWLEREVWDLFGIYLDGHSALRRIIDDYVFKHYFLGKDFSLKSCCMYYNDEETKIIYEPVELAQEYRVSRLKNRWDSAIEKTIEKFNFLKRLDKFIFKWKVILHRIRYDSSFKLHKDGDIRRFVFFSYISFLIALPFGLSFFFVGEKPAIGDYLFSAPTDFKILVLSIFLLLCLFCIVITVIIDKYGRWKKNRKIEPISGYYSDFDRKPFYVNKDYRDGYGNYSPKRIILFMILLFLAGSIIPPHPHCFFL